MKHHACFVDDPWKDVKLKNKSNPNPFDLKDGQLNKITFVLT